jgi:TctA family transporter
MDLLGNLVLGLSVALTFQNLTYALLGCMVGTLIGVLPGVGPVATIAMLLPITFHLPPTASLIMREASIAAHSMAARPPRSW